jgi:nitrogen fixation protein NifX
MFFKGDGIVSIRIAAASSDGVIIDQHFGKADKFLIFEIEDNVTKLIEERQNTPICGTNGHAVEKVNDTVTLISDCEAVFVSKIGMGPALALQDKGITVFEVSISINEALESFAKYKKVGR